MSAKVKGKLAGTTKADNYFIVDLHFLKANSYQSRGHGVIPNLNAEGYGLFSQDDPLVDKKKSADKRCLWDMLLSDKPEDWPVAVGLIDEHEPEIKELADSIAGSTQLHNIGITPLDPSDTSKGYDIVYGCRRSIARAYNYARSAGDLPATVKAEVAQDVSDPHDLHFRAMQENRGRQNESLIDEAKRIQFMKRAGLTIPQIADKLSTNQQNVRNRLQLLRLKPDEQQRVHTGRLGMVNALRMLKKREDGVAAPEESASDKPANRKRMHTVKQAEALYTAVEKPEDCDDELWAIVIKADVRRYFAKMLNVEYTTHADMVRQKSQQEKAKLNEEAVRKAAQEQEQEEEATAAK